MVERPDESGLERWSGLHFEGVAGEIWTVDADGNRERAKVFQGVIEVLRGIAELPDRADEIRVAAFSVCTAAMWAGLHDQPNVKVSTGGTAADLRELQRAHDLCFELAAHLYQMHRGSREALEKDDQRGLRQFQRQVAKWSDRAAEAWSALEAGEHHPTRQGRPTKDVDAAVRRVALREFEILTGRPAARKGANYGPLTTFFENLFNALGLNPAGAERQARQAIEERNAALAETLL